MTDISRASTGIIGCGQRYNPDRMMMVNGSQQASHASIPWADPTPRGSCASTGQPAFMSRPKRLTEHGRRHSANENNHTKPEARQGYIFGDGSMGAGYYSLETRDAFRIMETLLRAKRNIYKRAHDYYEADRWIFGYLGRTLNEKQRAEKESLLRQSDHADSLLSYVRARLEANGPTIPLSLELVRRHGVKSISQAVNYPAQEGPPDYHYSVEGLYKASTWLSLP